MYYFAYGSNMNLEHMRRLCGWHVKVLGVATMADYELGPDTRGFANVRPCAGKKVYGVLFEVDQHCVDILDDFEGYPEVFGRPELTVTDSNNKAYKAWVYVEKPNEFGGTYIKADYMRRVLAGAQENRLPEEWIEFLMSFVTK
jgi:gamma-glutamylcyclotransferase (GGCT)/AIG2-like uncharacterized protein YtfP